MLPLRSLLFVPGHKADWIAKALTSAADGVIIDLEDSVPAAEKAAARANAREAVLAHERPTAILVRPNGLATEHFWADIEATAVPGVAAYLLPMLERRDDVAGFDAVIAAGELANGVARGSIGVVASFETAGSVVRAEEILAGPRVVGLLAAAAKDADVARSVGFHWTRKGDETLFLRSRLLLAGRAAGLPLIVVGLWQDVKDLDGLREFAEANAHIGFDGQVLIHPSHAPVVNEVYGLSLERIEYYRGLVEAFDAATRGGSGAVSYRGEHIDQAHAANARERLRKAGVEFPPTAEEGAS